VNLSTEAKVGAVSLIGLLLLGYMIVYLGGVSFGEKGYPVTAVFSEVGGLKEGNVVRYAGVDIGKVDAVRTSDKGVEVRLLINPGIKIPRIRDSQSARTDCWAKNSSTSFRHGITRATCRLTPRSRARPPAASTSLLPRPTGRWPKCCG
jgi:hypothetical protein